MLRGSRCRTLSLARVVLSDGCGCFRRRVFLRKFTAQGRHEAWCFALCFFLGGQEEGRSVHTDLSHKGEGARGERHRVCLCVYALHSNETKETSHRCSRNLIQRVVVSFPPISRQPLHRENKSVLSYARRGTASGTANVGREDACGCSFFLFCCTRVSTEARVHPVPFATGCNVNTLLFSRSMPRAFRLSRPAACASGYFSPCFSLLLTPPVRVCSCIGFARETEGVRFAPAQIAR